MSPPDGIVIVGDGRIAGRQLTIWASLKRTVTFCSAGQFLPELTSHRRAPGGWRRRLIRTERQQASFVRR
ncbi:hypothetical protein OH687_36430 [Burkholderia anthina]|nr:hypothetical protein OH687_36430 [Burkholderia anthina]